MTEHQVFIIALSASESSKGNFVVVLEEPQTKRRLPIIIGTAEAQSIAIYYENLSTQRPLTHDLFKPLLENLQGVITKAVIYHLEQSKYYARLHFKNAEGQNFMLEARPSDALAIAIRLAAPIYVTDEVLEISAFELSDKGREKKGSYAEYSLKELEELLERIIAKEDYESAASLRNAIERRRRAGES